MKGRKIKGKGDGNGPEGEKGGIRMKGMKDKEKGRVREMV